MSFFNSLLDTLLDSQLNNGAFPAQVKLPNSNTQMCHNSFTTALVVLELVKYTDNIKIKTACERACDYLLSCQDSEGSGRFMFFPRGNSPAWLQGNLPADVDDTALCSLVLYTMGIWDRDNIDQQFIKVLEPYRIKTRPMGCDWFSEGIFPTWLTKRTHVNPIDVCVNINVANLILYTTNDQEAYAPLKALILNAVKWTQLDIQRLQELTPYYPSPIELQFALQRLTSMNPIENTGFDLIQMGLDFTSGWSGNSPICCSFGSETQWISPTLQAARLWNLNTQNKVSDALMGQFADLETSLRSSS